MRKKVPLFESESDEREFWSTADSTGDIDWKRARRTVLPDLRPSLRTISLRLPELMLEELKLLANKELRQPDGGTKARGATLRARIARHSARPLAQLAGTDRSVQAPPRRRAKGAKAK